MNEAKSWKVDIDLKNKDKNGELKNLGKDGKRTERVRN